MLKMVQSLDHPMDYSTCLNLLKFRWSIKCLCLLHLFTSWLASWQIRRRNGNLPGIHTLQYCAHFSSLQMKNSLHTFKI